MKILQTISGSQDVQGFVLPLVLIATGVILLSFDLIGLVSLDRVLNLWPVAVIAVGLADLVPPGASNR